MDVVWVAKLQNLDLLKNKKGQSIVEYILLLAVLSSIGYSFYNNAMFKEFIKGEAGLFKRIRQGMEYSYRYGRQFNNSIDYDNAMNFDYRTNQHDTYFNNQENRSRFFGGTDPYGGQ